MIQKFLATLMTYSISFQLILGGIPIAMLTSTNAHANKCAEGLEWNAILNRCLTSRQAAQVQSASTRCQRISDKAAQNKCYVGALDAQVKEGENKGDIAKGSGKISSGKFANQAMLILNMGALVASITTLKYLKGDCKGATSAWLMAGAAASTFAGEVMSGLKFQKKSTEAFNDFQKILKGNSSAEGSEVQTEALSAMIKREEAVIEAAGTKKTFYTISTAAYAAAGIMALLEARKYEIMVASSAVSGGTSGATAQVTFFCMKSGAAAKAENAAAINTAATQAGAQGTISGVSSVSGFGSIGTAGVTSAAGTTAVFGTAASGVTTASFAGAAAGSTGLYLGAGAIGGSLLLSGVVGNKSNDLTAPSNNRSSPSPSSSPSGGGSSGGGGSTGGDEGGSPDGRFPDPNSGCSNGICETRNNIDVQSLSAEKYLVSYFEKNNKISYENFYDTSLLEVANNWSSLYQLSTDLKRFRDGELSSSTLYDYENTLLAAQEIDQQTSKEDFTIMKLATKIGQQFSIEQAHSADILKGLVMILGMGGIGLAGATFLAAKSTKITALFISPYTRATLSGTMAALNIFMIDHISKEKEKAEKRKDFIEKLQLQVEAAGTGFGSCTPEQREKDMSKPHCYCYLQGGTINTARVKSATCKAFFGSGLAKNMPRPTSTSSVREAPTCTTPNASVIDESCSCRRTNSCTSIPRSSFTATGVSPASIGNINDVVDGMNNGRLNSSSINPQDMLLRAAALGRKQQAILKDPKNKAILDKIKKSDALGANTMRELAGQIASNPGLMNSSFGSMGSGSLGGGSPEEEIKKLQEDFKKDMSQYEPGTIGGGGNSLGSAGDDFNLDAVNGGGVSIAEDEKLAEVMDTNFEATGSDINNNSDANIFQILTYRYQRSAMRRLFGGEAMLPADKANETEISE